MNIEQQVEIALSAVNYVLSFQFDSERQEYVAFLEVNIPASDGKISEIYCNDSYFLGHYLSSKWGKENEQYRYAKSKSVKACDLSTVVELAEEDLRSEKQYLKDIIYNNLSKLSSIPEPKYGHFGNI